MEDYKKKYEEAFERARKFKNGEIERELELGENIMEYVFPELKESEDERIRKELLDFCKNRADNYSNDPKYKNISAWIAWLEKQGERKPTLPKWKYKKDNTPLWRDSLILNKYGRVARSPADALVSDVWVMDYDELAKLPKEEYETKGEQKPVDKVESKFKVDDWIVNSKSKDVFLIKSVNGGYCALEDTDGNIYSPCENPIEDEMHLWSIEDAKEGDVLASNHSIFIFSREYMAGKPEAHCGIMNGLFIVKPESCWTNEKYYPATKEQRDQLEKAIADAGYTFDFEKKELKEIEQKPTDNDIKEALHTEYEKSKGDAIAEMQNPAWSEEDEKIALSIEQVMNCASLLNIVSEKIDKIRSWLKSLKERYTWKPSDEHLKALKDAIHIKFSENPSDSPLWRLYEQLKKLKSE